MGLMWDTGATINMDNFYMEDKGQRLANADQYLSLISAVYQQLDVAGYSYLWIHLRKTGGVWMWGDGDSLTLSW